MSMWWGYGHAGRERVELETRITADQVRRRLEAWIGTRTSVVEHIASRWHDKDSAILMSTEAWPRT